MCWQGFGNKLSPKYSLYLNVLHLDHDAMGNIIAIHGNDGVESYRYAPHSHHLVATGNLVAV